MNTRGKTFVLGLHNSGNCSSAALLEDGKLTAGMMEERATRIKQDRSFPHNAIEYCLNKAGVTLEELTAIGVGWNAAENVALKYRSGFSDWMRYPGEFLSTIPNNLLSRHLDRPVVEGREYFSLEKGGKVEIDYVDHHKSHAAFAYENFGGSECSIVIADGWSEQKVTSLMYVKDGRYEPVWEEVFPNSIGCFYAAVTEYLGYKPFNDEWKVMGMAAYGNPRAYPEIKKLIDLLPGGKYELNLRYFDFFNFDRDGFFTAKMEELLGKRRRNGEPLEKRHYDIAASAQLLYERTMDNVLKYLHQQTGTASVVLSGGCAMNCLYNGKITAHTPFSRSYIPFAPDDSGNSIGAAMVAATQRGIKIQKGPYPSSIGPEYSHDFIGENIERFKLKSRTVEDPAAKAAEFIADGKVVGWFQGRMEFGQRALGSRSIMASPTEKGMKDRLNGAVKFRESFRPFAPLVRLEDFEKYFECEEYSPVRYMEKACNFRQKMAARVPAVVHEDGTGRVQTVSREEMPLVHSLVSEVGKLTGEAVVVNTSFNLNGEAIVCTPEDAVRTFVSSGMDALVIGKHVLEKGHL